MSVTMLRATDHVFTAPWAPKNGGRTTTTAFVYLGHLRGGACRLYGTRWLAERDV